jgi:LysM repeat protein
VVYENWNFQAKVLFLSWKKDRIRINKKAMKRSPKKRSKAFSKLMGDFREFSAFLRIYAKHRFYALFVVFEKVKGVLVDILYKQRGKYTKAFLHFGTIALVFLMVTFGPIIFNNDEDLETKALTSPVLSVATAKAPDFYTLQAEEVRQYRGGEVIEHVISDGETISSIAERYGLNVDTILWENDLTATSSIKPGQTLTILPIDGVRHKVTRGETIYSIGKKYGLDGSQVQMIVDYPFNEFLNDETFELVVGQYLMVPQGVIAQKASSTTSTGTFSGSSSYGITTPDAGTVSATGSFLWPAAGRITQSYYFYHKAIDIANRSAGPILAADAGVVIMVMVTRHFMLTYQWSKCS